jgi:hypothetical protein
MKLYEITRAGLDSPKVILTGSSEPVALLNIIEIRSFPRI